MKTLALLSFGIFCNLAVADSGAPVVPPANPEPAGSVHDGDQDLGLEIRRSYREKCRLRFYQSLEAEEADILTCWVTFIEEGGLDPGSISLEDVQRADKQKQIRTLTAKNGEIAATLELGTEARILLKARPETDDLFSEGQVAQARRHAWVLTMSFDSKSHALTGWDLKFRLVESPQDHPGEKK